MGTLALRNISKKFGDTVAVDHVDFSIDEGSFFTFLGPSGCGKTTILRMIAGFIKPDRGRILLGDRDIIHIPSENREVGMVFQNYALFPHMNVYENIAYGLKIKKIAKKEILAKVEKYLNLVSLNGYDNRKVSELSGGEQQRVALARSLIIEPKVLLLDEPLSNLDAKLRDKMRIEIRDLQKKLGITTIFVTHDQTEALTMSDKIAVFNMGNCVQIGKPREIYSEPTNTFVAAFVGETNLFEVKIVNGKAKLNNGMMLDVEKNLAGKYISIRPQDIRISKEPQNAENEFKGKVEKIQFHGVVVEYMVDIGLVKLKVSDLNNIYTNNEINAGDEVFIRMSQNGIKVLNK